MAIAAKLLQAISRLKPAHRAGGAAIVAAIGLAFLLRGGGQENRREGADQPGAATELEARWRADVTAGRDAQQRGDLANAERILVAALAKAEALPQKDSAIALTANQLGEVFLESGKNEEAEPHFKRALEIWTRALGPDDSKCAETQNKLGLCYFRQGKPDEAEQLFQYALDALEKQKGQDDPAVATALNNLAGVRKMRGDYDAAERLYLRSLAIKEKTLSGNSPELTRSVYNLARLYHAEEKHDLAERNYRRALRNWQGSGESYEFATLLRRNYAAMLRKLNRDSEADAIESGQSIGEEVSPPGGTNPAAAPGSADAAPATVPAAQAAPSPAAP